MDIQTKDGIILRGIPDGTPEADIKARIAKIRADGANPKPALGIQPFEAEAQETLNSSLAERIAANPAVRALVAAGRPVMGTGALLERLGNGTDFRDNIRQNDQMAQRGNEALRLGPWGTVGDVAGAFMSPLAAGALKVPLASTAAGRMGQGAAFGAASGATAGTDDPAGAMLMGAGVGAAAPLAIDATAKVYNVGRNVVDPLLPGGTTRAAGRLANNAAGDRRTEVINALRTHQSPVPGVNYTAGQASTPANSAEFAALQKMAGDVDPSRYFGPQGIEGQQNAARIASLRTVGGTSQDLAAAEGTRAANAATNYGAARATPVQADAQLAALQQNPYFADAAKRAEKLAAGQGRPFNVESVQDLHNVKMALDDMVRNPERFGIGASEAKAIGETTRQLVGWMEAKAPAYQTARAGYAAESGPINQMQVGQELEKRLRTPLGVTDDAANQRSAVYANALREAPQTIKKSTGQTRFDSIDQVLTPPQFRTVTDIRDDLANDALYQALAQRGMKAARQKVGETIPEVPPSGMFSPVISVARGAINRALGKATEKSMAEVARLMENPQEMARVMEQVNPAKRAALADALRKAALVGTPGGVQTLGRETQ